MKKSIYALALVALFSCTKETPAPVTTEARVIIANEGSFPDGISTLTLYDPSDKTVEQDVYQKNNGRAVGSLVNQVLVEDDRIFFVVNGTGSVVMANSQDFTETKVFQSLPNVRNIVKAGPEKYYVSSWGNNGVYILNTATGKVEGSVALGNGPGEMLRHNNLVFVLNTGAYTTDSTMSIIDITTDSVVATVAVGDNPNSLQRDSQDRLWVLCGGIPGYLTQFTETAGRLMTFSLSSIESDLQNGNSIGPDQDMKFADITKKPKGLLINKEGSELYFLGDAVQASVYKMGTGDASIPVSAFVSGSFYSMGYDPVAHEIYTTDPLTYTESGDVYRFSAQSGGELDLFKGGIIPGSFGFKD